ncbi:hypothetical protein [Streptomyces sp. NPDC060035]|uniref:hypothetical protein n=1 Tax=Streptomyces sp. NPDC060035 TaxID=3347044 RepID=UPI0036CDAAB6
MDAVRVGEHRGEAPELAGPGLTVGVLGVEVVGELVELGLQQLVVHLEGDRVRPEQDRHGRFVQQGPGDAAAVQDPAGVGLFAEESEGIGRPTAAVLIALERLPTVPDGPPSAVTATPYAPSAPGTTGQTRRRFPPVFRR